MKTSSAKQKGRILQQTVRDAILENFSQLEPDDVRSTSMGASGADVLLSPAAKKCFGYTVECKNQQTTSIWSWWDQCTKNVLANTTPLLVFKRNNSKPLVVITLQHFMELTRENYELKQKLGKSEIDTTTETL